MLSERVLDRGFEKIELDRMGRKGEISREEEHLLWPRGHISRQLLSKSRPVQGSPAYEIHAIQAEYFSHQLIPEIKK